MLQKVNAVRVHCVFRFYNKSLMPRQALTLNFTFLSNIQLRVVFIVVLEPRWQTGMLTTIWSRRVRYISTSWKLVIFVNFRQAVDRVFVFLRELSNTFMKTLTLALIVVLGGRRYWSFNSQILKNSCQSQFDFERTEALQLALTSYFLLLAYDSSCLWPALAD